ncbi:unnamed protein product [Acanthosepion pharaonis]|uniref:Uncharacterized protein n=1 Tax=Acanthosepion pharaonis TaxID=158019 RepID=A0A812E350_ACAPH|nr:unnamed protein product [Sepia pharaonis]
MLTHTKLLQCGFFIEHNVYPLFCPVFLISISRKQGASFSFSYVGFPFLLSFTFLSLSFLSNSLSFKLFLSPFLTECQLSVYFILFFSFFSLPICQSLSISIYLLSIYFFLSVGFSLSNFPSLHPHPPSVRSPSIFSPFSHFFSVIFLLICLPLFQLFKLYSSASHYQPPLPLSFSISFFSLSLPLSHYLFILLFIDINQLISQIFIYLFHINQSPTAFHYFAALLSPP